jgi:hypothetical protein
MKNDAIAKLEKAYGYFPAEVYDRVSGLKTGSTTSLESQISIIFDRQVWFIPLGSYMITKISVDEGDTITTSPVRNPPDISIENRQPRFFSPTKETDEAIAFVIRILKEKGIVPELSNTAQLQITECETHYDVTHVYDHSYDKCRIEKGTGIVTALEQYRKPSGLDMHRRY